MICELPIDVVGEILSKYSYKEIVTICSQTDNQEIRSLALNKEWWRRKICNINEEFYVKCCTYSHLAYLPSLVNNILIRLP